MFDSLVAAALSSRGVGSVGAWARVENAACARRLFASAEELERMLAADGAADREQWCLDNWAAVAASIAAAQDVSLGVASHQLLIAHDLRQRLPRVAEVFATGAISYRLIAAIVSRTRLIEDPDALASVDTEIAARLAGWARLSAHKTRTEIDYWVNRYDPAAVRRTEFCARGRHVEVRDPEDGSGLVWVQGSLIATDAAALDQRLDAMARAVCDGDPRTLEQRRADALGALGHGADRLACACQNPDCAAADTEPSTVVVHVIAHEDSLADDTAVRLDGEVEPAPTRQQLQQMTIKEAFTVPPSTPVIADTAPAVILGAGMLPAPLLAAKIARSATIVPIRHPGDTPPEPRYVPSAVLATFIRCRDMTCRFPGCAQPAHRCDVDHTIAYPAGPTAASNLKCLCRQHHLLKTFWGWHDQQHPDGTLIWTSPDGQRYTTDPGSRILFPALCRPTAAVVQRTADDAHPDTGDHATRALAMPRRTQTRTHHRTHAINDERRVNQTLITAQAQKHARNRQLQHPGSACDETYFPSRPRPPDDDPPPF